jgi:enoyl-CoA hydratase
MTEYTYITYTFVDDGRIVRVMLNRPQAKNAQNRGLLVELGDALIRAESDDAVRVVILGGEGTSFSAGHDLGTPEQLAEWAPVTRHPTYTINGANRTAAEARMLQEWHYFFDNTRRWRNLRKILVGEMHGPVLAGGLMLAFACDLVVAADDTTFADVVGTRLGMCGLEYFATPWEFGPRRTKELLLTGDALDADEAYRLGFVSKVFPRAELADRTLAFARRIAAMPSMTALLIKESVNQTLDNMGFYNALNACFTLHELNHSHWAEVHEGREPYALPADGVADWRGAPTIEVARKDRVGGPA